MAARHKITITSPTQRRHIKNAKNNRAKLMAAHHRQMVRNSAIALAMMALARFG